MRLLVTAFITLACLSTLSGQRTKPRTHRLEATPATVAYGYYWSEAKPVLRIQSGDIVDVDTLLTSTPDRLEKAGVTAIEIQPSLRAIVDQVKDRGPGGHILTGPIFVEGAEPGDALEVKVLSIDLPIAYGYNGCSGFIRENCTPGAGPRIIRLDRSRMVGDFMPGIEVPLRPFFGSMGVAPPPARGRVSSNPPDIHAGNLDNKELVAGTTLWIPVHVPGALFAIGDGHAAQGDGEVDQTAIETSLRGRVQLTVRKGMTLAWPRAETPAHYISMGTNVDLTTATRIAIQEMIDFLVATKGLDRHSAYQLTSIAGDVAITQLVDGTMGVHVKMPKSIFVKQTAAPTPKKAYLLVQVDVTDQKAYQEYAKFSPGIIAKFGGKYLARAGRTVTLEGAPAKSRVVVIEFPSMEQARAFYDSPEYVAARKLREGAGTAQFVVVEGLE
jgi:acetamidase/formamidase/uncharacterized protein (DUF1330 family)